MAPPLPQPSEAEASAEGRDAGNREEEEAGNEEADHLVVMVNGLYGRCACDCTALFFFGIVLCCFMLSYY